MFYFVIYFGFVAIPGSTQVLLLNLYAAITPGEAQVKGSYVVSGIKLDQPCARQVPAHCALLQP